MGDLHSDRIALAQQHVLTARGFVTRQRTLMAQIRERGGDYDGADQLLVNFEQTLAIFEEDLAWLVKRATDRRSNAQDNDTHRGS